MTDVYRERYLKIIIKTLKENVSKTSNLELDDMLMTHFGISIEEQCYAKNPGLDAYSRAITMARVNIERNTTMKKLFPLIAKTIKPKDCETTKTIEQNCTENNNGKQRVPFHTHVKTHHINFILHAVYYCFFFFSFFLFCVCILVLFRV